MLYDYRVRSTSVARVMACVAILALPLAAPRSTPPSADQTGSIGDGALFRAVIEEMRAGESYYSAMGATLRRNDYPTVSVFNWRTPLLYRVIATFPSWKWPRLLLTLLAALAAISTCLIAAGRSSLTAATTGIAASGVAVMMSAPAAVGMAEAWAGSLIALSVWRFRRRRGFEQLAPITDGHRDRRRSVREKREQTTGPARSAPPADRSRRTSTGSRLRVTGEPSASEPHDGNVAEVPTGPLRADHHGPCRIVVQTSARSSSPRADSAARGASSRAGASDANDRWPRSPARRRRSCGRRRSTSPRSERAPEASISPPT